MADQKIPIANIRLPLKMYLKWYLYPLIYFFVTSLVCAYAWYGPYPKGAVKVIFKSISVIPTVLGLGIITLWILVIMLFKLLSFYLKQKTPNSFIWNVFKNEAVLKQESSEKTYPHSLRRKAFNSFVYFSGMVLIIAGILLLVWIARPYFNLLLSSSKIQALEQKVAMGQIQGNRIIIPSVLVDAPIIEGVSESNLSRGVCHIEQSSLPGERGNVIIEGHNLAEFGLWRPQSFFSILEIVDRGTPIYVFYNGRKFIYKVKDKIYRDVGDPKLYETATGERLTLITCVSTWSPNIYTNRRTVVIAYPDF